MNFLAYSLVAAVVALHVYGAALVTYHVAPAVEFEPGQKVAIMALAWLLPILGTAICIGALRGEMPRRQRSGFPLLDYIFLAAVVSSAGNHDSGVSRDNSDTNDVPDDP